MFSSCITHWRGKPLQPGLLFTVGSNFLKNVESVAVKGSIRFEGAAGEQSGSFQLIANDGDSLTFLLEGPFKVDIFKLVVVGEKAFARDRNADSWTDYNRNDRIEIPEYGIEGLAPFDIGYYIFPQFFFRDILVDDAGRKILLIGNREFLVKSMPGDNMFSIWNDAFDLFASYSKRKEKEGGYFPSAVSISSNEKRWKILVEIEKVKLNPRIPDRIWARN